MTWALNASGHTPTPDDAENWELVERELSARLHDVLSDPRYGATTSHFGGNYVTGPVHVSTDAPVEKELRPAVADLLRFFECGHLPSNLQAIAYPIRELAHQMAAKLDGPQLSHGLHALLRAKDSFVRAALPAPSE